MYKNAHIFFIDAAVDAAIATIGRSVLLKPRVKCLVELNMNFIPKEDLVRAGTCHSYAFEPRACISAMAS
jgi:hypothetical protein